MNQSHIFQWLATRLIRWACFRKPGFLIGGLESPYLVRWHLLPRNPFINAYVHKFCRSDDDRALHDHPWANCSILLRGSYTEHTIAAGGVHHRQILQAGAVRLRLTGRMAHRIELHDGPCWTLFITGPRYRRWGFHCPSQGWVHWKNFVASNDKGAVGKGCEQ